MTAQTKEAIENREFRYSPSARWRVIALVTTVIAGIAFCIYGLMVYDRELAKLFVNLVFFFAFFLFLLTRKLLTVISIYRIRNGALELQSPIGIRRLELTQARIRVRARKDGKANHFVIAPGGYFFLSRDRDLVDLVDYLEKTIPYESSPINHSNDAAKKTFRAPRFVRFLYIGSVVWWSAMSLVALYATLHPNDTQSTVDTAMALCLCFFASLAIVSAFMSWKTAFTISIEHDTITKSGPLKKSRRLTLSRPSQIIWKGTKIFLQDERTKFAFTTNDIDEFDTFVAQIEATVQLPPTVPPPWPYVIPISSQTNPAGAAAALSIAMAAGALWVWTLDRAHILLRIALTVSAGMVALSAYREWQNKLKRVVADPDHITFEYVGRIEVHNVADLEQIAYQPSQQFIGCVFRDTTISIPGLCCPDAPYIVARNLRALYADAIQNAADRKN